MKKRIPAFKSDEEAEKFLEQDLSDYMHTDNFTKVIFKYVPLDKTVSLRMTAPLLNLIKSLAKKEKIPYQKLMREFLERGAYSRLAKR